MAWKASGDERGKSYRVYQELEAEHRALQERVSLLEAQLRAKEAVIRAMASELSTAPLSATPPPVSVIAERPTMPQEESDAALAETQEMHPRSSPTAPPRSSVSSVRPSGVVNTLRPNVPLSEQLGRKR